MVIFLLFPSFMVYAFAKPLERCIRPMDNTQRQKKACFYFFFSLLYGPGDLSTIFWDKTIEVSIWLPNLCKIDASSIILVEIKQAWSEVTTYLKIVSFSYKDYFLFLWK